MKRGSYRDAISWIANNDDNQWIEDFEYGSISVTAALVADIWDVEQDKVIRDLKRELTKTGEKP